MSNGVVEVDNDNLPILAGDSIIMAAEQAEKRINAVNKIKTLALKVTNYHDWTDQGGKPYLQVSGCEKIARLFGISWRIDEPVFEQETDGNFAFTYKGYFSMSGITIEAIGTRGSKDGFFTRGGKLQPSEVDRGDLKKAAYTNCIGNGISRLLGIRNMTWEEVRAGGVDTTRVGKVDYKNKNENVMDEDTFSDARKDLHKRIETALTAIYGEDQAAKNDKLIELTTWTKNKGKDNEEVVKGITNFRSIKTDKTVEILCAKLEKMVPQKGEPQVEICNECRQPMKNGACRNSACPEAKPEE